MAGVWVTACLPGEAAGDIGGTLREALAPFYLDTDDNPVDRGMWNAPHISGGSDGMGFAVTPGHIGDPRLIHDDPGYDASPRPSAPGVCAGEPRALLDFSQPNLARERAVAASWDLWHSLSALHTPAIPLAVFVDRRRNDPEAFPGDRWGDEMLTGSHPPNTDVLTLDGWWLEGGIDAVHASCDPGTCPHDPPKPAVWQGSEAYVADLPGDTILVRLHCHA